MVTGHQVAIKILNRRKIRSMDMDEKGEWPLPPTPSLPSVESTYTRA